MSVNRMRISKLGACLFLFTVTGLTGCDKISSTYEHLTNKNPETSQSNPVKVVSPSTNTAAETPKTKEVLPENIIARVGDWSITVDEFKDKRRPKVTKQMGGNPEDSDSGQSDQGKANEMTEAKGE